mmetsp:Transcript_1778/g.3862  ORF Transcript_1778/g.3862 Transcript_1778/m.3862 type:complete len:798 (+) Transcript_1778:2082-4475(+)
MASFLAEQIRTKIATQKGARSLAAASLLGALSEAALLYVWSPSTRSPAFPVSFHLPSWNGMRALLSIGTFFSHAGLGLISTSRFIVVLAGAMFGLQCQPAASKEDYRSMLTYWFGRVFPTYWVVAGLTIMMVEGIEALRKYPGVLLGVQAWSTNINAPPYLQHIEVVSTLIPLLAAAPFVSRRLRSFGTCLDASTCLLIAALCYASQVLLAVAMPAMHAVAPPPHHLQAEKVATTVSVLGFGIDVSRHPLTCLPQFVFGMLVPHLLQAANLVQDPQEQPRSTAQDVHQHRHLPFLSLSADIIPFSFLLVVLVWHRLPSAVLEHIGAPTFWQVVSDHTLASPLLAILLLGLAAGRDPLSRRFLCWRPVQALSEVSGSIYAWGPVALAMSGCSERINPLAACAPWNLGQLFVATLAAAILCFAIVECGGVRVWHFLKTVDVEWWASNMHTSGLVAAMLLVGAASVLLKDSMMVVEVPASPTAPATSFYYPMLWTAITMTGMSVCWPLQKLADFASAPAPQERPEVPGSVFFVVTSLQWIALWMTNYVYSEVPGSVVQMLRGTKVILTVGLSIVFLKKQPKSHEHAGAWISVLGIMLVSCFATRGANHPKHISAAASDARRPYYCALCLMAEVVRSVLFVYQEKVMKQYSMPAMQLTGSIGVTGLIISSVLVSGNWLLSPHHLTGALYQLKHSSHLSILVGAFLLNICLFELTGITLTKRTSASLRALTEMLRTIFIWVVELWWGWTTFNPGLLMGFSVLIVGFLTYQKLLDIPQLSALGQMPFAEDSCALRRASEGDAK